MEKQVIFDGSKGKLFGVLHIPESGNKSPGVVLFHGFTGSKCESHFIFTKLARRLCKEGISVLRFDFYGSGDSEGEFKDMTIETEINDGEKAIEYFKNLKFVDREKIGILGLSMGGLVAVCVASKFKVKALCLWSAVAFPLIIKKKLLTRKIIEKIEKDGKAYIPGIGHYISKDFLRSVEKIKIEKYVENYKGDVFIIHTKDDKTIDLRHSIFYFDKFHRNSSNLKMLIFDKGGHTFTTEESELRVIEETTDFFKEVFHL